jgi:ribosomal protein L30E
MIGGINVFNKLILTFKRVFFKRIKVKKENAYITIPKSWIKEIRKSNDKCIVVHLNSTYGMRSFISYYKTKIDRDVEYNKIIREAGLKNETN